MVELDDRHAEGGPTYSTSAQSHHASVHDIEDSKSAIDGAPFPVHVTNLSVEVTWYSVGSMAWAARPNESMGP